VVAERGAADAVAKASAQIPKAGKVKLRPDHKLVYRRSWETAPDRLAGVRRLTTDLARIAAG
jgi:hypothetical protein